MKLAHLPTELVLLILAQCTPNCLAVLSRTSSVFHALLSIHGGILCKRIQERLGASSDQISGSLARQAATTSTSLTPLQNLQKLWYRLSANETILAQLDLDTSTPDSRSARRQLQYGYCLIWEFKDTIECDRSSSPSGPAKATDAFLAALRRDELEVLYLAAAWCGALLLRAADPLAACPTNMEGTENHASPLAQEHYPLIEVVLTRGVGYIRSVIEDDPEHMRRIAATCSSWTAYLRKGHQNTKLLQKTRARKGAEVQLLANENEVMTK